MGIKEEWELESDKAMEEMKVLPPQLTRLVKISEQTIMVIDELLACGKEGITEDELHGMFHEVGGEGNFYALLKLIMESGEVEMVRQGPTTNYRIKEDE